MSNKAKKTSQGELLQAKYIIKEELTPGCYIKKRYILALMGSLAKFCMYAQRTNLSVAIVAMVNTTQLTTDVTNHTQTCPDQGITTIDNVKTNGIFTWNSAQQGLLLGSYFYGYIVSNVPGGYLAKRFGVRSVLCITMLLSSIITIFSPLIAGASFELLVAARIVLGIMQGAMSPALHASWGKWAPPLERSRLLSIPTSGGVFGVFVTLPISGFFADNFGWESVFHITGGIGIPWCIMWIALVYSSPAEHPRISEQEREYIVKAIGENKKDPGTRVRTPWKAMMTSIPVWAIIAGHFSNNWGNNTLMIMLPTYLSTILRFNLSASGSISSLPFVLQFIVILSSAFITDIVRSHRIASTTTVRKVNMFLGLMVPATSVVLAGYVGCNNAAAVAFFSISVAFIGFTIPGCEANTVDVAPKYGGIIYGISNTIGNVSGFLAPQLIGFMLLDGNSLSQWQNVFWMTAAVYAVGAIIYLVFASGVEQPWAGGEVVERKLVKDSDCERSEEDHLTKNEDETEAI